MPRPTFARPIAHRGLHDRENGVVENSVSAFERAVASGYDIECDLQLSADNVPLIFHDERLERLTGREGVVSGLSAADLAGLPLLGSGSADRPQRFGALLEQIAGRALLQVELKQQRSRELNATLAHAAVTVARGYKGPLVFQSFDPAILALVRRAGFKGPIGIITFRYNQPEHDGHLSPAQRFVARHLVHWPWSRFDFISANEHALTLPGVRFWRALGSPVTAWTIRSPDAARTALAAGADQIVFEGFKPGA